MDRDVEIGSVYKHFKGNLYKVLLIAKDSENLEDLVIYTNVNTNEVWARNKNDFLSLVDKSKTRI